MPKIRLEPQDLELEAPRKANLMQFLHGANIVVGSSCGGKGICGSCKITVLAGAQNLSRPRDVELDLADRNHFQANERLSCQSKVLGDIVITTNYW